MGRNYEALRRKILGEFGELQAFARAIGITPPTLSHKLRGRFDWRRSEIERCIELLGLTLEEVKLYFFD